MISRTILFSTYRPNFRHLANQRYFSSSSETKDVDLVVIGGGPGGYVAAIKAAQLGLKTACVEKRGALGGTCLNVGCIPSKALLHNSHLYHQAVHEFSDRGIEVSGVKLNLDKLMAKKSGIVKTLTGGIEYLFKKNKVDYAKGHGKLLGPNSVQVTSENGSKIIYKTKNIILATGSEPRSLSFAEIDDKQVVNSTGAMTLTSVPKNLVVIGAGTIGLELGSVWARLGSKVTVVEGNQFIGGGVMDSQIAKEFQKLLISKDKINFELGAKVINVKKGDHVAIESKSGEKKQLPADVVLVAVGRKPYTENLGLEDVGIKTDSAGRVPIKDASLMTSVPGIFAIGDIIAGPMLAHKAEEEGIAVVENIVKPGSGHVNYNAIPSVVYTSPEVAWVGISEDKAKADGIKYRVGVFPFLANSRAKATGEPFGLVKIITDMASDKILGAHILGPNAGELIAEVVLAVEYGATAEDVARTCHAHPTLSEAIKEACMAAYGIGKPIHF